MQQTPEKERRSTNSGLLNGQKSNGSDLGGRLKVSLERWKNWLLKQLRRGSCGVLVMHYYEYDWLQFSSFPLAIFEWIRE